MRGRWPIDAVLLNEVREQLRVGVISERPGALGGIRITSSNNVATDFPPQRNRKSTPFSGGANSPSSRLLP